MAFLIGESEGCFDGFDRGHHAIKKPVTPPLVESIRILPFRGPRGRYKGDRIALLFHRPSEKPSPNVPSQKPINESHQAQRASPSRNPHPFCNLLCRLTHVVLLQKRFALCKPLGA